MVSKYRIQALEAIANRTLRDFDPSLLLGEPCAVPIEDIIEKHFGLFIEYQYIRNNGRVLGQSVFTDGVIPIYDYDTKRYEEIFIDGGTIIADASLLNTNSNGRLRFTLAHELAHFIIHQEQYLEAGKPAALIRAKNEDVIEREADILGTCLLMPIGRVKKAFHRLRSHCSESQLVLKLAKLFNVSKQAMEIRLREHCLI